MVEQGIVNIDCDNVDIFVAGIPCPVESAVIVTISRIRVDVSDPEQIFYAIRIHHAVKD